MNRRRFLGEAALAGAAWPALMSAEDRTSAAPARADSKDPFIEPARELPRTRDADVIACGGGPAGVAAAISAARCGARVRLFEVHGCLGGVWTSGLLTYVFDFNKPGLTRELLRQLHDRNALGVGSNSVYVPEEMKLLLEDLCVEAGVTFQLFTRVTAAYRDGRRLNTIVTESKSGRQAWTAPVFIDATGDGDLGAQAGCAWETGISPGCPCQPMTMNALAVVKDATAIAEFMSFYKGSAHIKAVMAFNRELKRAGVETSYGHPTIFHIRGNLVLLMLTHEYNVMCYDSANITAATVRSRAEIHRVARALSALGGAWEGLQVVATAEQIGVREGRRIRGRYMLTKQDLVTGAQQPDGVTRVTFWVDIHALDPKQPTISTGDIKTKPYDIPLRALIASDVDGLLMAGRCISGDFIAHASYRVTGNAVAMGEAAGVVAALAVNSKRLPHEVEWSEAAALREKIWKGKLSGH